VSQSELSRDELILVDEDDNILGYLDKDACHDGAGRRQRAFSAFLLDRNGRVLLQQRSRDKRLWPGYWSNSCCSHPRRGESTEDAVSRRLQEELGYTVPTRALYRFEYRAHVEERGAEHELCWVYVGSVDEPERVDPNPEEIAAIEWTVPEDLDRRTQASPRQFTPWFLLEWQRLRTEHPGVFRNPEAH